MEIILNGEKREVKENIPLIDFLKELDLKPESVAVELNLNILNKKKYNETVLKDGDRLEVVHFVGGG
jgi:sulfur carrier protein